MNLKNTIYRQLKSFLIILILILFLASVTHADQKNKNIKFKHLNVEDGLTHHETLFVYQDSQGFLWFGTKYGLNKYDGMTVKPYFHDPNPENKNSLVGDFAHWIQEDREGSLWISTWGDGISKYDPRLDKFTNYRHDETDPQSLASNNVWSLFVDSKGLVWSATDNGISILNPQTRTFVNYRHDPENSESLSNNMVSRIREDVQGIYWISTYGGGLNRFDPDTEKFKNYKHIADNPLSLSSNNLWGVYIDSKQRIWIASEKGLIHFQPETDTFISYQNDKTDPESLSSNTVTVMYEDRHGKLWLGTFGGGLNRFDPDKETFEHFRHDSGNPFSLSNDIIMSICEDKDGAIWAATYGGIDKYDPGEYQFEYYRSDLDRTKTATTTKIRSIFQDKSGFFWMGTGGDGVSQLSKERKLQFNFQHDESDLSSINDNDIWAITEDRNGYLWIATHGGGLNQLDPARKSFVRYKHDPKNSNTPSCNPLYDLSMDRERNVLWIAAYLTGLDKFDLRTKTFSHYKYDPNNPDGIVSNWVTVVFVDSKGFVWVGTEAGLSVFNPETEKFKNFKHNNLDSKSLSANMLLAIYEDSKNNIWIGTTGGLNRYERDTQSFERYSQKDGLAGNHIVGIVEDNSGYLWVSSENGLSKFDPENKYVRNYNRHDGLQGDRFLMHSVHKNEEGELFFGGTNGFNAFNPKNLNDNLNIPKIVLTDFKLFNKSVLVGRDSVLKQHINQTSQISLEYDQDVFSIEFIALNYRNSQNNKYAYMMKGFDTDFINIDSNNRSVTYTNLDPGTYTFHVKASNNDGIWNQKDATLKIIVKPPWWETNWFKSVLGVFFLLILLSVFKYVVKLRSEIIERKKTEEALKRSEKKLAGVNVELSAKNEELEQVVYVASHDLRSPLVNIDGYSRELEYSVEELNEALGDSAFEKTSQSLRPVLDEDIPEALRFIRTSTLKMETLLSGLLRLSRSGRAALAIETLDMNDLVSRVLASTEFQIKESNVNRIVQDLPPCKSDAVQIDQIFTNLLDNAFKCLDPDRPGIIKISGEIIGDHSVYCIEDNGIGIDKNHINKIFEIFHQLDPGKNKGEGLGLTIVKRILFRLGGLIRVESQFGEGSRFYVSLPRDVS